MADFIDDEASEASSSDEEFLEEEGPQSRSKKGNKKKSREIVDSSEEEEDDDEEAEEEMRDLINDEEEEDDDESSDEDGVGTKRSHDDDDESSSLEEDDLDLIEENTGRRITKKKKFKRIRKLDDEDSDEEEADEAKQIGNELFGPSDLLESDDEEVQKERSRPQNHELDLDVDDDDDESNSDDNFIVDDNNEPIRRKKDKSGKRRYADSAMQQAQEVFGVEFDYDDVDDEQEYEDDEAVYDEEYGDEVEAGARRQRRKREGIKTIEELLEPSELERAYLTEYDKKIRAEDEPERFRLRSIPVTRASEEEIKDEANWIFQNAFDQPTISVQELDREPIAGKRSELIKSEIESTLSYIRNEKLEVPFIAAYRREYVPSLSPKQSDTNALWTIYNFDEQWCKLQSSKRSISSLYINMRDYLATKPADPRIRKITDNDIMQAHNAKTFDDIEDCRLHFQLYYSHLVNEMKLSDLEKKIEQQKAERAVKSKSNEATSANAEGVESNGFDNKDEDNNNGEDNEKPDNEGEEEEEPEETEEEKLYKRLSKSLKISSYKDRSYQLATQNSIGELVKKFGLTPEEFGENLRDDYQRNTVSQNYTRPLDEAANHIKPGTRFATREDVLEAAKLMYSREVSRDPLVRQTVRKYYFESAVISIEATERGHIEIDENHPCYSIKYLRNKHVYNLEGDQILHIIAAEKLNLLKVRFSIEPVADTKGQISPYHESLKALFYSDFSSIVTKEWNELREEAIRSAFDKIILPRLEQQLREKLVKEAQDKIIKDSCEKLHDWLNVAPYAPSSTFDNHEDFELRNGTRICGFTFAPEADAPCFAVIVDSEGELIDHVRLPYLNIRKRHDKMNSMERENHEKDRIKFKQFIINRKPHVVALAAETIQTKYICQHLAQILDELRENHDMPLIPIEIVDNELSNVYMNLKLAREEFPEFPPLLLQAISNARKLNDPPSEYAKLCSPDHDILCIRLHPLQDELSREELLKNLYQRFVTIINLDGVDPNRVIAHPHTTNIVQFIGGLGPRKAAHLLRSIKKSSTGQLVSRQQLVKELGMTSVVFMNCSGFIKLDTDTLAEDFPDEHVTPLDSMRVHPESYGLAKTIASNAISDGEDDEGTSEETAIEMALDHPEKLDELDLAAFARDLEETQNLGKKALTLQSIKEEFQCRYRNQREPYKQPNQHQIFTKLTKETLQSFNTGKLITCQVVQIIRKKPGPSQLDTANPVKIDETNLWRCPFCLRSDFQDLRVVWDHFDMNECPGYGIGVKCKLDNGLFGFVPTKFLSDSEIVDPSERVQPGQTIHARVIKIDEEKFSCDLTCRTTDLIDAAGKFKPMKDQEAYDYDAEMRMKERLEAKRKRGARQLYCKRVIVHPAFENIDCKTCEKKLQEMEQGHAIIRPSSKGQNYLTLSWKVADNINQHVAIREEEKENAFSLGRQLFIGDEPYEDLDEIIARYIQPMASYARELLNYKYCLKVPDGIKELDMMQNTLFSAKAASSTLPYRFAPSREYPGKFLLGYMPKDRPKIEFITVTPRGYKFRNAYFKNLASLIKWFKENWNWTTTNMMSSIQGSVPMSQ